MATTPMSERLEPCSILCNRAACKAVLEAGKTYFNQSTRRLYCWRCAVTLNRANRDEAMRLYAGPLCVLVAQEGSQ